VTLRARWVTLRARWVTLRACWVTLRACWVTLRARWVTLRARWVTFTEPVAAAHIARADGFPHRHGVHHRPDLRAVLLSHTGPPHPPFHFRWRANL
jgi:hypothetical protein